MLFARRSRSKLGTFVLHTALLLTVGVAMAPDARAVGTVSISSISVTEGNATTRNVSVPVTFSEPLAAQCDINWLVTPLTATSGVDIVVQSQVSATFPAGSSGSGGFVPIRVIGDIANEPDETVRVQLVNDADATPDCPIGTSTSIITIANDDPAVAPTVSVADATFVEGDANGHNEPIVITSAPTGVQLTCEIGVQLIAGTATSGSDFGLGVGGGVMTEGDTALTINAVRVFGDTINEDDETLTVRLVGDGDANLDCPIGDAEATVTIVDDDTDLPIRTMSLSDATAVEGTGTNGVMTFTMVLNGPANGDEVIEVDTVPGSAASGTDYVPLVDHVVTFAPGTTTATVDVQLIGDTVDEGLETFTLQSSDQQNVNFGPKHDGVGTIEDDDGSATPMASIRDAVIVEGNSGIAQIGVTIGLDRFANGDETMRVLSSDGTATVGSDYVAVDQAVAFQAGQTTRTFLITVNGDATVEPNETFTLTLVDPKNVGFADSSATVTITNDDVAPPTAPSALVLTSVGPDVHAGWTDTAVNETAFEIQRARWVAGVWSEFVTLPANGPNDTTAIDRSVPDGLYAYLVRSTNSAGSSDWLIGVIQHNTATSPANTPGALSSSTVGKSVVLSWTDTNTTEFVHEIGRARFNPTTRTWGEWVFFLADRDATTFTNSNPPDGQYAYLVRATNGVGASDWAITVITHVNSTGVPATPTRFGATASSGNVRLSWADNATNEVVYELQRARLILGTWIGWTTVVLDKNTTSFTDLGVPTGTYAYLVRATNPNGSSDWVTVQLNV